MIWLSDVAASHIRIFSARVAPPGGAARFARMSGVAATFVLTASLFEVTLDADETRSLDRGVMESNGELYIEAASHSTPLDASVSNSAASTGVGSEEAGPYCPPRLDVAQSVAPVSASSASFPLQKWHPGRETGPQSNGSLRDGRAANEAPSADEPNTLLSGGGPAECKGS